MYRLHNPRMRKNVTRIGTEVPPRHVDKIIQQTFFSLYADAFAFYVLPRFRSNLINVESKTLPVNCRNKDKCIKRISSAFHCCGNKDKVH